MRDNLLIPLRLRTHVFMHGANATASAVATTLSGVDLARVDVRPPILINITCADKRKNYPLVVGLSMCYDSIQRDNIRYTWIVRLRTDHMVPFRMSSLPCAACYYATHPWARGIAITASLGECTCGWAMSSCDGARVECDWTDDQFALLHGDAIRLYLHGMKEYFCNAHVLGTSESGLGLLDPERRVARLLRNTTIHDIRFLSAAMHPRLQRTHNCSRPGDGRMPRVTGHTLEVPTRAIHRVLPDGPWDQRRVASCSEQRLLPADERTGCLPYAGEWDDEQFGKGVISRLYRAKAAQARAAASELRRKEREVLRQKEKAVKEARVKQINDEYDQLRGGIPDSKESPPPPSAPPSPDAPRKRKKPSRRIIVTTPTRLTV